MYTRFIVCLCAALVGSTNAQIYVDMTTDNAASTPTEGWLPLSKSPDPFVTDPFSGISVELEAFPSNLKIFSRGVQGPFDFCTQKGAEEIPFFSQRLFRFEIGLRPLLPAMLAKGELLSLQMKLSGLFPDTAYTCKLYFGVNLFTQTSADGTEVPENRKFDIIVGPNTKEGAYSPLEVFGGSDKCFTTVEVQIPASESSADRLSATEAVITLSSANRPIGPAISALACFPTGSERVEEAPGPSF